jgi:hypothetical protein
VAQEAHQFFAVLEAPLTHVQALNFAPDKLFGIKGRVPWLDKERAEDDFEDVGGDGGFMWRLHDGWCGCAIQRGRIRGHWCQNKARWMAVHMLGDRDVLWLDREKRGGDDFG